MFKKEEVDKLALKVAEAVGEDLLTYTPNQIRAFEQAMGRLLKRRNGKTCNANSASAALNKWLKPRVNGHAVVHSLRHSMRDRLRAAECPSDIIDQIGGWSSSSVGSSYGKGYELPVLAKWMKMMEE